MFSKILDILPDNVTYICAILFAIAMFFVLKTLLEYVLKLCNLWCMSRKLAGPTGLPVLGNLLDVMGDTENLLKQILQWAECYPSPFCVWLGPKLHIGLCDPDSIKELLQNQKVVEKSELYSFGNDVIGNGLLTAPAKVWRGHRKLLNTLFNSRTLAPYGTYLTKKSQEMVKEMEVELHGKGFEFRQYLDPCVLKMILGTILGTSLKFEAEALNSYLKDIARFLEIAFFRVPRIWLYPNIIFKRTALGQESSRIVKRLFTITKTALEKADLSYASRKLSTDKNDASESAKIDDGNTSGLYMGLPRDRDDFTYQDFFYELNTIIGAAPIPSLTIYMQALTQTTKSIYVYATLEEDFVEGFVFLLTCFPEGFHAPSTLMEFLIRMLAYHPDIQNKVYQELYSIYGAEDGNDRPVEIEDLPRMDYLERVIFETMRLFPPAGLIERGITEDVDIGSYILPAGCTVLIVIMNLHRNEKYWLNPLKFDPDRFLPENVAKRHPGAYIPFSIGPRNCIGGKYAMMAVKIFTATLLRRYILRADTIVPIEKIRLKTSIVLECVEPWKLHIEDRKSGRVEVKRKIR